MKRIPRINPFFTEIILVMLFVSLASLATVQLFAATHTTAKQSQELNHAMILAQSAAESIQLAEAPEDLVRLLNSEMQDRDGKSVYSTGFDKDWKPGSFEPPAYVMETVVTLSKSDSGTLLQAEITVSDAETAGDGRVIFTLPTKKFLEEQK